jgi:xanthine dehydrogenase YagS FAD-binding subunit
MAPALIALGAKVKIVGSTGERVINLEELFTALGNILGPDELITEIQTPTPTVGTRQRYLKFRQRKAIDFAISSVAAVITTEEKIVSKARIILGGVSPTPYRAIKAEEVLQGETISEKQVETAVSAALEMAKPLAMNAHKIPITEALLRRALVG